MMDGARTASTTSDTFKKKRSHEGKEVFVTFSAGVTAWRPGEAVEASLARADEGLYEAKRTGKNRTCIA